MYKLQYSWAYNTLSRSCTKFLGIQLAVMQQSHDRVVLCTQIWHDFCTHADLLMQPMSHTLQDKMKGKDMKIMAYSPVMKIPESEGLLVRQCTSHLGEFGLTVWVVTILMYTQEFHHTDT